MKLALYVHDFKLEIGHSNSLIELIRHLPPTLMADVTDIKVVSFSVTALNTLFPDFKGNLSWVQVPFKGIKPVLLKSIFYQLWTFFYNFLFLRNDYSKIGIGISSLSVDFVSIQFIHHQWTQRGLKLETGHGMRKFYKKILFAYFEVCENYLIRKKKIRFFSPASFLTNYLKIKNPDLITSTIYSGVNLSRFELSNLSKDKLLEELLPHYPILKKLDTKKPIYLFVGAYERKGLLDALDILEVVKDRPQFIVIGSPSMGKTMHWPQNIDVFPISFTKEVHKFYSLSDSFIFPTMYEPFGLVLFEAMAMGLTIITRREEVGASELLEGLEEVYFCDQDKFSFPKVEILNYEKRVQLRLRRLQQLGDVSWHKAGNELARFLQLTS